MVDQTIPPLSVEEAKARLLALDERAEGSSPFPSLALPAAAGAMLLGFLLTRRKRRGLGLMSLGALAANPALRSALVAVAGAAIRRFVVPPAR